MTPKEHANRLGNKMYNGDVFSKTKNEHLAELDNAKRCSLNAIDEVLIIITAIDGTEYWQEHYEQVKQEIKKL
jgi:translation elongation factor EF-1alpha